MGLKIYALMGDESLAKDPEFIAVRDAQEAILAAYRAQDWDKARALIAEARPKGKRFKLDDLYDVYESRMVAYEEHPPPPDWDGTFIATSK